LNAFLAAISLCSIEDFLGGCFVFGFSLIPSPKNLTASRSLLSTDLFIALFSGITCLWEEAKILKVSANFSAAPRRAQKIVAEEDPVFSAIGQKHLYSLL
jgi:hypothetical protein